MLLVCLCKDYFGSLREAGSTLVLELAARQSAILGCPAYFPSDGPHLQDILYSLLRLVAAIDSGVRLGTAIESWLRLGSEGRLRLGSEDWLGLGSEDWLRLWRVSWRMR